jgi:hypothetical protein
LAWESLVGEFAGGGLIVGVYFVGSLTGGVGSGVGWKARGEFGWKRFLGLVGERALELGAVVEGCNGPPGDVLGAI